MTGLAVWFVAQLKGKALDRTLEQAGLKTRLVLDPPLERALRGPTGACLRSAIRSQLGPGATAEAEQRAVDVLGMTWTDAYSPPSLDGGWLDRIHALAVDAFAVASAPVVGLPPEFQPTSSLTALGDELGVDFDATVFAEDVVQDWAGAVRQAGSTDPVLSELADQVRYELAERGNQARDELMHRRIDSLENRLQRTMAQALQGLIGDAHDAPAALLPDRERWFRVHVARVDALMSEVFDDYVEGFDAAARACRSREGIEDAIHLLQERRTRRLRSRLDVKVIVRAAEQQSAWAPDDIVATAFRDVLSKAADLLRAPTDSLAQTWYGYFIVQFEDLRRRGQDPRERSNYAIAGDHDLLAPMGRVLSSAAHEVLPARWAAYAASLERLRSLCLTA